MAFPTVKAVSKDVITMIGQVAGTSVQTYTEPLVLLGINRVFEYLFNKRKWEHLWTWEAGVLDGTTGKIVTALSNVTSLEDIVEIRNAQTNEVIPLSSGYEHTLLLAGANAMYRTPMAWNDTGYDGRFFKFWPVTALDQLAIYCGHRPAEFEGENDIIPMNKTLMVNGVTWWMLADDGLNPASAEKAQALFDISYQDIIARLNAVQIGHGKGRTNGRTVFVS